MDYSADIVICTGVYKNKEKKYYINFENCIIEDFIKKIVYTDGVLIIRTSLYKQWAKDCTSLEMYILRAMTEEKLFALCIALQ